MKRIRTCLMACALAALLQFLPAHAQQNDASRTSAQQTSAEHDGQHDFDPLLGRWKYHLNRRLHPLTGSNTWVEFDGTGACFRVWDGGSQLDTIEVDGS